MYYKEMGIDKTKYQFCSFYGDKELELTQVIL